MKKSLIAIMLMCGLIMPSISLAKMSGVTTTQWDNSYDEAFWLKQTCDEVKEVSLYNGDYGLYIDNFIAPSTNTKPLYILDAKVVTTGKYVLYNNSYHSDAGNGMSILNRNILSSRNWKINPGDKVRHMTTAEEVNGASFANSDWRFDSPFTAFDGKVFRVPNYRSNGKHPESPTNFPKWDTEFRTITLYDTDDTFSTSSDNNVLVECQRVVIRWCGDGILDENHEECDPSAPGWDKTTCDPATCKKLPVCNSFYSGQELTDIVDPSKLCNEGTVKNFKYNEATRTWTWECETAGTGVECSAKKIYNGTWTVEKTLVSETKYITKVGQELVWEIKVTAQGGDLKDMKITDKLPPVLDYVSYSVVKMPSGITIASDQPTFSNDKKTVYWQTKGDFKAGETIVLRVVTKANAMPKVTDNYKNVACASPEGEEDKCDDEPVKTEGMLKIEKTLTGKMTVQKTGEVLTWNVKVTALGGDVDGFEIQDIVPFALQYIEYSVASNPDNLTVKGPTGPVKTSTGNVYTWNVAGVLQSGHSLLLTVKTEVVLMPKAEDDYRNVACVIKGDNKDCDDDKPGNPDLWIKKSFTDGSKTKTVKIGDEIGYQITFGNNGNAAATITSIKDFLPKNVEYITGTIVIQGQSNHENTIGGETIDNLRGVHYNKTVDGVYIDIYTGITLKPGESGYIILTGKVLTGNQDSRTNFACIYLNDKQVDCDDAVHNLPTEVMCKSNIASASNDLCNGNSRTVPVTCNADGGTGDTIEIFCDGNSVLSGHDITTLSSSCTFSADGEHTVQCKVNGSTKAAVGSSCEGIYKLSHHSCGGGSSCFIAGTKVLMADGTYKNIELVQKGEYVMGENNTKNLVKGFDRPTLDGRSLWSINGSEYFVSDEHPFKTTDGWKAIDPVMAKHEITEAIAQGKLIKTDETKELLEISQLTVGDILIKENGKTEVINSLESRKANTNTQLYNFELGGNNTYYANGYLVHNKGGGTSQHALCKKIDEDDGYVRCTATDAKANFKLLCGDGKTYIYDDTYAYSHTFKDCKEKDGAICYVKGKSDSNWKTSNDCRDSDSTSYCESHPENPGCELADPHCFNVNAGNFSIELGEYLPFYFNIFRDRESQYIYEFVQDNESECQSGTVDLKSMKCKYIIENPKDQIAYSSGDINCLELGGDAYPAGSLIRNWANQQKNSYGINVRDDVYGRYWPHIEYTKSSDWKHTDILGEYEFKIEVREYRQCIVNSEGEGEWKTIKIDDKDAAVCQSNFVLTEPYTVQKTPSGNLTASTDTLQKFKEVNGADVGFSRYIIDTITPSTYTENNSVSGAMENFIQKYEKLAVAVKGRTNEKKVPGKNIYFINGDYTVKGGSVDTPFTFVQTNPESTITVIGNSNFNMMILTRGNIAFQGDCTKDQNVKGIFYAKGQLKRTGVLKNDSLQNNVWCTQGGLHIKGVLIGKDFKKELMDRSRSHLETWYKDGDKKTKIMNGASVLIEYSPSIFNKSTMPPGAEYFTTALSIYKQ